MSVDETAYNVSNDYIKDKYFFNIQKMFFRQWKMLFISLTFKAYSKIATKKLYG
jgi:hypothetical protein